MVSKIIIENTYGIWKQELDFEVKDLKRESGFSQEDQILKYGDRNFSLFPSFIGKNATGKTGIVKAINFAGNFFTKKAFARTIGIKVSKEVNDVMTNNQAQIYETNKGFDWEKMETSDIKKTVAREVVDSFYTALSISREEDSLIKIFEPDGKYIEIITSKDDMIININNSSISISSLIKMIINNNVERYDFTYLLNTYTKKIIKILEDLKYEDFGTVRSVFVDESNRTPHFGSIYTKRNMLNIFNKMGSDFLVDLLKTIDNNISRVEFDEETNQFGIFTKKSNSWAAPISAMSYGTRKILEIFSKSLDIFEEGGVLIVDEIENGLHLSLISLIIKIFSDPEINTKNCQLLFTTHSPLVYDKLVDPNLNMFFPEDGSFIRPKYSSAWTRNGDAISFVKPKNYYNSFYWQKRGNENKSTLSPFVINRIISETKEKLGNA